MPKLEAITLKQLRALRAIADHGSITAAANELGLTPPAVHTQVKGLEQALNCTVLESSRQHGPTFTPEGQTILDAERQILAILNSSVERVRALKHGQTGVVVLGVVSTAKYFVPGLVAQIGEAYPDIDVILKVGNRQDIIRELSERTIDMAIMGRPPRSPANIAEVIGTHPHVFIAASDHPLAGKEDISPADFLAQTFLSREQGSGTLILMTRYLDRLGEGTPYRAIEMGSNETIKQAVIANLGIALISQHTTTEEIKSGRLVTLEVEGLPIVRQWFLLHREDVEISNTLKTVRDFILDLKASFLPTL
ncbi:LysR family regulator CbbR [Cohaesibacter gelatinilyticus]|uniref:HTH-type transcriptional regulator CbbR n=1 Tax=Cohaesibacter gelatinilyticus TaxID=372072 RepID=A0A285PF06_9HYPH|nr:LysR family transcriptional regulator [Cohaesibacter gelatinilyticus]SNZ20310.1 ModE molybdate transport repressor domain-containing protein [Cohaesibacter gelatinilyticus]